MKVEPSSDHRQIAAVVRQTFVAFIDSGFDEEQAMELTKVWLKGVMPRPTH